MDRKKSDYRFKSGISKNKSSLNNPAKTKDDIISK